MRFRLTPRSMTLDDPELLQVRIFGEFRGVSQISEATTAKRMEIDPYCQRQRRNLLNVLFNTFQYLFLALICHTFFRYGAFIHALLSRAYLSVSSAFLYALLSVCL